VITRHIGAWVRNSGYTINDACQAHGRGLRPLRDRDVTDGQQVRVLAGGKSVFWLVQYRDHGTGN
jgi:hypothetical protein